MEGKFLEVTHRILKKRASTQAVADLLMSSAIFAEDNPPQSL